MPNEPTSMDEMVERLRYAARNVQLTRDRAQPEHLAGWEPRVIHAAADMLESLKPAFQARVDEWLIACFGEEIARDAVERNHRFLEESLELVQACGCTASEAHQLVDYVFGRPVGEIGQEIGGVMNTLAALCLAYGRDMIVDGHVEMDRCWQKIDKIREKQRNKPKHSPLPQSVTKDASDSADTSRQERREAALRRMVEIDEEIEAANPGYMDEAVPPSDSADEVERLREALRTIRDHDEASRRFGGIHHIACAALSSPNKDNRHGE